jgi:hypothetical protein
MIRMGDASAMETFAIHLLTRLRRTSGAVRTTAFLAGVIIDNHDDRGHR